MQENEYWQSKEEGQGNVPHPGYREVGQNSAQPDSANDNERDKRRIQPAFSSCWHE